MGSDIATIPQACQELGISPTTGYKLARDGKFPGDAAFMVGESWRVSLPKLRRHIHGEAA